MHSSTIMTTLLALAVSPLTLAAPSFLKRQTTPSGPITLIAAHSTSPIHLQPITASNLTFHSGSPTKSYCPIEEYGACPTGNVTAIEVGGGGANMDVAVPGGQQIYVLPTGALAFTPANSEGTASMNNGTTTGFTYVPGVEAGELGVFDFEGLGWLACPETAADAVPPPYQIFASLPTLSDADVPNGNLSACIGLDALGTPFTAEYPSGAPSAAAWEYA